MFQIPIPIPLPSWVSHANAWLATMTEQLRPHFEARGLDFRDAHPSLGWAWTQAVDGQYDHREHAVVVTGSGASPSRVLVPMKDSSSGRAASPQTGSGVDPLLDAGSAKAFEVLAHELVHASKPANVREAPHGPWFHRAAASVGLAHRRALPSAQQRQALSDLQQGALARRAPMLDSRDRLAWLGGRAGIAQGARFPCTLAYCSRCGERAAILLGEHALKLRPCAGCGRASRRIEIGQAEACRYVGIDDTAALIPSHPELLPAPFAPGEYRGAAIVDVDRFGAFEHGWPECFVDYPHGAAGVLATLACVGRRDAEVTRIRGIRLEIGDRFVYLLPFGHPEGFEALPGIDEVDRAVSGANSVAGAVVAASSLIPPAKAEAIVSVGRVRSQAST